MEDFTSTRAIESSANVSGLQAEWMANQSSLGKMELAAARTHKHDEPAGPGKDVADRLDKELRQFANEPQKNASEKMVAFQGLVNKFEDAPDKKQAISDFGHAASKLRVDMLKDAESTYKQMEAEAAKDPGRKALVADRNEKTEKFFDQLDNLPSKQKENVMKLMDFKSGESTEDRDARVRDGIKDKPALLSSFNSMETAAGKVESAKSPVEKELGSKHDRDIEEAELMHAVITKASIRSTIQF